jgi:predicted transcriptional regulator
VLNNTAWHLPVVLIQCRRFGPTGHLMDNRPTQPMDFLVSVRPQYAAKILDGEKTVELRRRFPNTGSIGATVFIYSSSPIRALVGSVKIKDVQKLSVSEIWKEHSDAACISRTDFYRYFRGVKFGFAIMLGPVKPMTRVTASDLKLQFGIVPPQSYRYVAKNFLSLIADEQFQAAGRYKHSDRARGPSARSSVAG